MVIAAIAGSESNTPACLYNCQIFCVLNNDTPVLTLSCMSVDLKVSIPSLARCASTRVNIFTKAWRLSTLTMHVWTTPKREKISRSTSSDDLQKLQLFLDSS